MARLTRSTRQSRSSLEAAEATAMETSHRRSSQSSVKHDRESHGEESKAKRVKMEGDVLTDGNEEPQNSEEPGTSAATLETDTARSLDIAASADHAVDTVSQNINARVTQNGNFQRYRNGSMDSGEDSGTGPSRARNSTADVTPAPDVDFSSAPSDPTELAFWVAKQISRVGDGRRDSADTDGSGDRQRLLMHPPALFNRRFDDDDDPVKVAEREKTREENRERKKRWRESNAERNKDNDLRCRINKRAKIIWGATQTVERAAWMEEEFNKRRAKRENKERVRSFDDGFPGFAFAPGFGSTLFPAPGVGPQGETNAAGLLLANALLGVGSSGNGPNAEAANALKAALEGGKVDPRPFTEALRAMAANPEIMSGINAILGGYQGYEEISGDDETLGVLQSTESHNTDRGRGNSHTRGGPEADNEESEIIKKLNQATAMLNQLNESNDTVQAANGFTAINGAQGNEEGVIPEKADASNEESQEHALDQAQIDALLTLANGGALTRQDGQDLQDDGADPTAAAEEVTAQEIIDGTQPDSEMSAILQRIIQQVMAQKDENAGDEINAAQSRNGEATRSVQTPFSSPQTDPYGVARNPAMALSSLLHCAGMSINTVIPAAQGRATSQLYARLSNHSRSSTPSGGGINPAHASAFGSTAMMNQKLLAKPNAYSRPLHTPNTTPRAGQLGPPPKPRNVMEDRKAKSFGFPPLPGKKLVIPRRSG